MHVTECPQCGAPARAKARACRHCRAEFLVSSLHSLYRLDLAGVDKYVQAYDSLVEAAPRDPRGHLALGLCLLRLGKYDRAIRHLRKALELAPDEADLHFYYGLALMRGRRPGGVTRAEVCRIEEYVCSAIRLDGRKAKYYCMAAMIKYDHYYMHGLQAEPPSWEELLDEAQVALWEPDEIERLLEAVMVREEELVHAIHAMM